MDNIDGDSKQSQVRTGVICLLKTVKVPPGTSESKYPWRAGIFFVAVHTSD
jgi:hypothetical protein